MKSHHFPPSPSLESSLCLTSKEGQEYYTGHVGHTYQWLMYYLQVIKVMNVL